MWGMAKERGFRCEQSYDDPGGQVRIVIIGGESCEVLK